MRTFAIKVVALALVCAACFAWAANGPRTGTVSSIGGGGAKPAAVTSGVALSDATGLRVRVTTSTGTVTGGKVCCYYLPTDGGATGWVRNPSLDMTIPAVTDVDGGTVSSVQLPDLRVTGSFGRASWTGCGITGTATDGGTNTYTVTTEAWGATFP